MATAILAAKNCLDEERAFMSNPRRKSNRSKRKSKGSGDFGQKGAKHPLLHKTAKEGFMDGINSSKNGNDVQMGQVSIFKGGEAIKRVSFSESTLTHLLQPSSSEKHEIMQKPRTVEALKKETKISSKSKGISKGKEGRINDDGIVIASTEHLGPDPSNLPREGSGLLKSVSSENVLRSCEAVDILKVGDIPAFANSPPPSCLPLPKFSLKQNGRPAKTQVGVNTMATRDLRRLLGLE